MKVDLNSIFGTQNTTETTAVNQARTTTASSGKTDTAVVAGVDSSALSQTASILSSSASDSDVRMDKVQTLQAAISNGTYNVSSSAIADKLIQSMLNS